MGVDIWLITHPPPPVYIVIEWPLRVFLSYKPKIILFIANKPNLTHFCLKWYILEINFALKNKTQKSNLNIKIIWKDLKVPKSKESQVLIFQSYKLSQPVKIHLNKKLDPEQKTLQAFNPRVQKNKKWKSFYMGNRSYLLTSAGQSALV